MSKREDIADHLTDAIDGGEYTPGTHLPSEHELARMYDVSRLTARAALEQIANNGLIEARHGSGWFVRNDRRLSFPLLRFDQGRATANRDNWNTWLDAEGLTGNAQLVVTIGQPPRHVRQHLELPEDAQCAVRRRIRRIDNIPVMISTGYFPMWLAADTEIAREGEGADVDMQDPSPLRLLHQMGHVPVRDLDLIGSRRPSRAETNLLQVGRGSPVITVCRTSTDASGRAVRCTADVIAGDRFYLTVDQTY